MFIILIQILPPAAGESSTTGGVAGLSAAGYGDSPFITFRSFAFSAEIITGDTFIAASK